MTRIARLDSRALIAVTGDEARPWLHDLVTQDVLTLEVGAVRYGALLSPQGRMLFDLFLWGREDGVALDVAASRREALMTRLAMYRLRRAVEIAPLDTAVFAAWHGEAEGFVADPRLPGLAALRLGEATANADEADWIAHLRAQGVAGESDFGDDRTYPIEANLDLLNGIDFHKGCFVGQETTSRMKRRGTIKNRMAPIRFDGAPPPPGSEVLNGDLRAGEVLSGHDGMALALLRLDRLDGALTVDGRPVSADLPVWMG